MHEDSSTIHNAALIIDTHADTPQRFLDEHWNFTDPVGLGHLSLDTARRGNLAGEFFAIWAEPTQWAGRFRERTLALLEAVHAQIRRAPDQLALCTTADQILSARRSGRFAVLLGIEGGHSIENSLENLRLYHSFGARYLTLTWSNSNDWADSSGDAQDVSIPRHDGLTSFGREVVREMNHLGMIVDVSHGADSTLADVLSTTRAPIFASHSSARALANAARNLNDDQLRAIAANGGTIMVNLFPAFLSDVWRTAWNDQRPERQLAHQQLSKQYSGRPIPYYATNKVDRTFASRLPRVLLSTYIDHIDHIAQVAGVNHVGIGTDFDGVPSTPEGLETAADLPKVTAALFDRGYSAKSLRKILGGNLLRVFREVEAAADAA